MSKRVISLVLVLGLLAAAACGRSGDETEEASEETPTGEDGGGGGGSGGGDRLANGEFGDLGTVCQDGNPSGTPQETGITDEEIRIGTVTDKGAEVRAGLTQEMYDTTVAFAEWCNEHGGINGRELVVDDLDAKLSEYPQRIEEACQNDFALVGGGAVFDNTDNGQRVECGLISIPGYTVTPEARVADLQVQPVPNPVHQWTSQIYRRVREVNPDLTRYGLLYVDFGGVTTVHQQVSEVLEGLGYEIAYDQAYAPIGETGWDSFVQDMERADVQVVELIGEPENLTSLLNAMASADWYPEVMTLQANMYDQRIIDEAGGSIGGNIYMRDSLAMFDMGDEIPAVADYLQLMEEYNPEGRYPALLGAQALSSMLLFATSAAECGDELTRQCVLDNAANTEDWTAGGLQSPTTPGNAQAPRCGLVVQMTAEGFQYNEEYTDPNDGVFNCSEDNVYELTGDYGVEPPQE